MVKGCCAYGFKMFVVSSLFLVGISGCDKPAAKPAVAVTNSIDSPVLAELSEHWLDAAKYLKLASRETSSERTSLQYSETAKCALVYDFEITTTTASAAEKTPMLRNQPQTQQLLGRFELKPDTSPYTQLPAWRLHSRQVGLYTVRNEIRLPGKEAKDGEYPDVMLQNTGVELQSAKGDSPLWNQLHAFGGLSQFFPRMPTLEQPGSGKKQPVQAVLPGDSPLRISEHILVNNEAAVVMVATDEQFVARYIVLNSGRLLHAAISRREKVPTEQGEFIRTQVSEARLTGACEEPTLPPIGFKTSRVRKALDTYTRLVFAVHGDQNERALPYLSQDLIDAHGADNILAMLKEHIGLYGIGALGDPSLVDPVEVDGEFLRFRVVGRAEKSESGLESAVTIVNYIVIEDGESGMHVLSIGSTTNQATNHAAGDSNMLEISPRRIFTASRSQTP